MTEEERKRAYLIVADLIDAGEASGVLRGVSHGVWAHVREIAQRMREASGIPIAVEVEET